MTRYTVRLEWIGRGKIAGCESRKRPWVARLTGLTADGFVREFVRGQQDIADANSAVTRGAYLYFHLADGVYEIDCQISWNNRQRYYCRVCDGQYEQVTTIQAVRLVKAAHARDRCADSGKATDRAGVRRFPEGLYQFFRWQGFQRNAAPDDGGSD
mgnify:CR=1 FL=1